MSVPRMALVIPPVHAGIVPSALPAVTAPTGVNSLPNLSASASLTFANVDAENAIATEMAATLYALLNTFIIKILF